MPDPSTTIPPHERSTRSHLRWVYPLLITVGAGLLVLLGFEIYLRRTATYVQRLTGGRLGVVERVELNPELFLRPTAAGYRLRPNTHAIIHNHYLSKRDVPIDINSNGFRGGELPAVKRPGDIRILVLGDSITLADYVPAEESFVGQMEIGLRARIAAGETRRVDVINAGVFDVGIREEIDILKEQGLAVRPDVVLLAFYLNDSRPPWGFEGELEGRGVLRRYSLLAETLYKKLVLWRWIAQHGADRFAWVRERGTLPWRTDRAAFLELAARARYDWGAAWDDRSWSVIDGGLSELVELASRHGFKLVVAAFPVSFQVLASFSEDAPQQTMARLVGARSLPFCDLLPLLREHRDENLFFDQCHLTPVANELVGRRLAALVATELGPPSR